MQAEQQSERERFEADEAKLIEKAALHVGMKSLMNHGAASCVYSEGCNGVTQDHLIAFAREIALHCAAALSHPSTPQGWQPLEPLELNVFAGVCYEAHIAFALDNFPSYERAIEHYYITMLNAINAQRPPEQGGKG